MSSAHPPITFVEYERLFRVIHGVLLHSALDPAQASLFFAVAGAFILKRQHKLLSANPVAGAAAYALPAPATAPLCFGRQEDDALVVDAAHPHCWIEADGWIIDLCAPLFDAHLGPTQKTKPFPPCMFQHPAMPGSTLATLNTPGAALHRADDKLTTALLKEFSETPAYADLVRLCALWYARPPKKLAPALGLADAQNRTQTIPLSPLRLAGAL